MLCFQLVVELLCSHVTKTLISAASNGRENLKMLKYVFADQYHNIIIINDTVPFLPLTEQDKYDVREDVASTETLLQTKHYQERAWTKTFVQVYQLKSALRHIFQKTYVKLLMISYFGILTKHNNNRILNE